MSINQVCKATSSFLVPGKRRQGSSEYRDWRSQARPIHQKLDVSRREWCVSASRADKYRGEHEPGHLASGCCFGESRKTEIFPAESKVPCGYGGRWRICSQMLLGNAARFGSPLR